MIEVTQTSDGDPLAFDVRVTDQGGVTRHHVTMTHASAARLTGGHTASECVQAAFRFLLDREDKESILPRFDIAVIPRYFPDFEARLPEYLGAG